MVATWTEAFSSFTPAGTGWQNYDIFTNKSVPKGAIAHIAIGNLNQTAARTVGVRTDGSALNRYVKLHESEGTTTGQVYCTMYVKVDSSTGLIETYADTTSGVTFWLLGYWTGVDYTEKFQALTVSTASAWTDADLTAYMTDGAVAEIILCNRQDGAAVTMGVRTNGSSKVRSVSIHEAESASAETTDCTTFTMCVKTDASGIVEYYTSSTTTVDMILLGYFGTQLTYIEDIQTGSISATGWTDWDLTAYLDQDGRVVDVLCANSATAAPYNYGVRKNGSALARYLEIHESETNATNGFVTAAETDTSGIVELYGSNASNEFFRYLGYYKPTEKDVVEVEATILTDVDFILPNKVIEVEAIALADVAIKAYPPWSMGTTGPNTVCTNAGSNKPLNRSWMRRFWKANGYHWCMVIGSIYSSPDKSTWTAQGGVSGDYGEGDYAAYIGAISGYDTYAVWLTCLTYSSQATYVRRAKCNSDGTLTLDTQTSNLYCYNGYQNCIAMAKNKHPWQWADFSTPDQANPYGCTNENGSPGSAWTMTAGYITTTSNFACLMLPFGSSGERIIWVRPKPGTPVTLESTYTEDGSTKSGDAVVCSDLKSDLLFSGTEDSGNVHVIYNKTNSSNSDLCYKKFDGSAKTWGSEIVVRSAYSAAMPCTIAVGSDGAIYVFWVEGTTIKGAKMASGGSSFGGADDLFTGVAATIQGFNGWEKALDGEIGLSWLEGTSGSWTVKAGWVRVEATPKTTTDTIGLADVERISPNNVFETEALSLKEFSLIHNSGGGITCCYVANTEMELDAQYQNHLFRTPEKYDRFYIFGDDSRYFKAGCEDRFLYTLYSIANFLAIDDFGAGSSEDKNDDVFWDAANLVFRCVFLMASTHYMRIRTLTPNQTPSVFIASSGQTDIALDAAETQECASCAYSDSTYWMAFLETSVGVKLPKFKNAGTWGATWGSTTTIDANHGAASAVIIVPAGGSVTKTVFLYVTGSTAGSYSIRAKYYNGSLQDIGEVVSDLYGPKSWSANTDEQGNVYIVYLSGASQNVVKLIKIAGTTIGSAYVVASGLNHDMDNHVHVSVDKRKDREVVYWTSNVTVTSCYLYRRLFTQGAPAGDTAVFQYYTGGNYFSGIAGEPNTGYVETWVGYRNAAGGGDQEIYLDPIPGLKNCYTTDSASLAETIIAGLQQATAIQVLDALGLSDSDYRGKAIIELVTDALSDLDLVGKGLIEAETTAMGDLKFIGKSLFETETLSLADIDIVVTAILKSISDSLALVDQEYRGKDLVGSESLYLSDVALKTRNIIELVDTYLAEVSVMTKDLKPSETISLTDIDLRGKAVLQAEALSDSDAGLVNKPTFAIENVGMNDAYWNNRPLVVSVESVALADIVLKHAARIAADAIALSDLKLVQRGIFEADVIGLLDAKFVNKTLYEQEFITAIDQTIDTFSKLILDTLSLLDADYKGNLITEVEALHLTDAEYRGKLVQQIEATGLLDGANTPLRSALLLDSTILSAELVALNKQLLINESLSLQDALIRTIIGIQVLRRLHGRTVEPSFIFEEKTQTVKGSTEDERQLEGDSGKKTKQGETKDKSTLEGLEE